MTSKTSTEEQLRAENAALRACLEKAEERMRAEGLSVEGSTDITEHQQAEEAMRRSEENYRLLVEGATGFAIIRLELDGRVSMWNVGAERMLGYRDAEILGEHFSVFFTPEDQAAGKPGRELDETRHTEKGDDDNWLVRKDGTRFWASGATTALRDEAGNLRGYAKIVRDITERKVADDELHESRKFTRRVLDNLFAFVGVLTVDGTLIEVNRAPLEGAGLSPSEVLGKKFWDCSWWSYSPEVQARLRAACERAVAGEVVRYDELVRMAGETTLWIDFQLAPLRDSEGRITHLIPSGMDITERRRSAETVRQSAELFVCLVDQAPTGMYVIDADFRLQQVNALAAPVFAKVDRLIGRDFAEVMEVLWGPTVGAEVVRIFRHTLATGERYVSPSFTHERYDIGGEQAYEWQTQRVSFGDGRNGVVCYFDDVTERHRGERAIRESETRLRLATEATAVGIWEWNVFTNTIRWDAQLFRLYGIPPTADGLVHYREWSGAVLPEDLAENERILQDTVRTCGQSRREFRIRRRDDGEVRDIEAFETVRMNAHGQAEWVVGTNLDITERKRSTESLRKAAEEIARASRAKDDFLAALSHELRTPLTPVLMMATALEGDPALPLEVRDQLGMMRRNVELQARLIDDLLDITRIARGKLVLASVAADLHRLLEHTAEIVRSDKLGKQVRIVFSLEAERHHALADPARLQQVFWNLIKNALKFTPTGGTIAVRTRNDAEGWIVVNVEDNGVGISAEALPHIFTAFEQGDMAGQHRYGGLGLGLAISQAIVEAHGGTIQADSKGAGHGATFTVILASVEAPAEAPPATTPCSAPAPGMRLLVVEDHEATRTVLSRLLTRSGHQVTTAGSIHEALLAFAAERFDAVVSDLGLPDGSGLDLMREIQRQRPVPGIALSGYGMENDMRQTKEAGFFAHLVKPVNLDQLRQLLAQLAPNV